ncbi:MAG TPA: hypothetical protein VHE35_11340 [Kofleriaceae bacterium]|nr:hypothetical protein [Kofleriaceae bacterium]
MSAAPLRLEVLTPDGDRLVEEEVEAVVVHRREARFAVGSEVAILPGHAPALIRIPEAPLRYRVHGREVTVALGAGYVEVMDGRVRVLAAVLAR